MTLIARGDQYARHGEYDKAIADYTEAIRLEPKNAAIYAKRAWSYARKDDDKRAFAHCAEAIRLDPKLALAYANRGLCYAWKGEYDRAIADGAYAIRLEPTNADLYYRRGSCYSLKRDHDRAIADYTEAIRIDPNLAWAYYRRGRCHAKMGHHDQAIADCSDAIRLDPKSSLAYSHRAECYDRKGEFDKAIADYTEAMRIEPTKSAFHSTLKAKLAIAYCHRGERRYRRGEFAKSIADLTEAIRLRPSNSVIYSLRAKAYRALGDKVNAASDERMQSAINLKYIMWALQIHNDTYNRLPASASRNKSGKPLLSWRVAILPFLGEEKLYYQFKLDEPWDSAHNKALLARMPKVFAPPNAKTREEYSTYYQVFTGKGTPFGNLPGAAPNIPYPWCGGPRLASTFTDGLSNTVLVAEAATAVPWTKPADIEVVAGKDFPKLGGRFEGGFHAATADGTVHFLRSDYDPALMRILVMAASGDKRKADGAAVRKLKR